MNKRWMPHVTVAAIVEHQNRFLLVEEHTDEGLKLNMPAGHLEAGESLLQAVVREVLEETARAFAPQALVGVYLASSPDKDGTPTSWLSLSEESARTLQLLLKAQFAQIDGRKARSQR